MPVIEAGLALLAIAGIAADAQGRLATWRRPHLGRRVDRKLELLGAGFYLFVTSKRDIRGEPGGKASRAVCG